MAKATVTGGGGGTQGTITKVSAEATPVDDNTLPTGGNQSTVNIGTDENRGGNLEKATLDRAKEQNALQTRFNQPSNGDWRVRIRLAPNSNYLYNDVDPGILAPLKASDGVIFPYTPQIQTAYSANYEQYDLVHSNYRGLFYKNSRVGDIQIRGMFTAQNTTEANYLLAVIHFFRTITKMFYGQDQNPNNGVPPPLCYLTGLGAFQFDNHPLVINSFNYTLPNDVDYIRAGSVTTNAGVNLSNFTIKGDTTNSRLQSANLTPGAQQAPPNFQNLSARTPTYVPTKMQIQVSAFPIVTRNDISNRFSVKKYATGQLLQGSKSTPLGGIW